MNAAFFGKGLTMNAQQKVGREIAKEAGSFFAHAFAIVLGMILVVVGIAMGVSIALVPIGIPTGLTGLLFLMWGLFGAGEEHKLPPHPLEKR
jgi:uncharacterized membrane protein YccF (DUF307 family)